MTYLICMSPDANLELWCYWANNWFRNEYGDFWIGWSCSPNEFGYQILDEFKGIE